MPAKQPASGRQEARPSLPPREEQRSGRPKKTSWDKGYLNPHRAASQSLSGCDGRIRRRWRLPPLFQRGLVAQSRLAFHNVHSDVGRPRFSRDPKERGLTFVAQRDHIASGRGGASRSRIDKDEAVHRIDHNHATDPSRERGLGNFGLFRSKVRAAGEPADGGESEGRQLDFHRATIRRGPAANRALSPPRNNRGRFPKRRGNDGRNQSGCPPSPRPRLPSNGRKATPRVRRSIR